MLIFNLEAYPSTYILTDMAGKQS